MNRTTILNIVRIVVTVLWRLALCAAVLSALCCLCLALVLNMVFNGPSITARDQLTMTLLESERTSAIPGYFLREDTIAAIRGNAAGPSGITDPNLQVGTGDVEIITQTSKTYTAQITRIPGSMDVRLTAQRSADSDYAIFCGSTADAAHFAGITQSGVLQLAADATDLRGMEAVPCAAILIWNGEHNEALFTGNSGFAPRAALGQTADGTLIFVTTDGWTREHPGATYQDMINILAKQGAVNGCLLGRDACMIQKEG